MRNECVGFIDRVEHLDEGWRVHSSGTSFWLQESPVIPKVGMPIRKLIYLGSQIRALWLEGVCIFHRTEQEQEQYERANRFGESWHHLPPENDRTEINALDLE